MTKIRMREQPDITSAPTGDMLDRGEVFEVEEVAESKTGQGPGYLKVAGKGWVFDEGIAGKWVGKPIVEMLTEAAATAQSMGTTASTLGATASTLGATASTVDVAVEAPAPAPAPQPATAQVVDTATTGSSLEPAVALAVGRVETLRMPSNMLGAGFELVQVQAKGSNRPLNFLLGSGFPINALTEKGRDLLGITPDVYTGGWASQATAAASSVEVEDVRFMGSGSSIGTLKDCEVLDFPQATLCEQMGIEIHGMLGRPFFEEYDLDLDRYKQKLELYAPGQASSQGFYSTVKFLPGMSLPGGNLGIALRGAGIDDEAGEKQDMYFVGLVDTGAAHTVINWEAAKLLGYDGPNDSALQGATRVLGAGPKGVPEEMPVVRVRLSLCGVMEGVKPAMLGVSKEQYESSGGAGWYFQRLTEGKNGMVELGAVNVAIGDVLGLQVLSDSKVGPFQGAAAIIGQDLLFQNQRVVLNMKDNQMWVEPGDVRDADEM